MPPTIHEISPTSAPSSVRISPDVPAEHERAQPAAHRVELVEAISPPMSAAVNSHQLPSQTIPRITGSSISETRMRDQKALIGRRTADRAAAKAAKRILEVVGAEVGPEGLGEDELGVGASPRA